MDRRPLASRKERMKRQRKQSGVTCQTQELLGEVRRVYEDLARRPLERNCIGRAECCHFKLTGKVPFLTRGEALVLAREVRAGGRKKVVGRRDGACPLLDPDTKRCLAYAGRPFGCRTHFCAAAGGPYARKKVLDLIRRLEVVDIQLGGTEPRSLPAALKEALSDLETGCI